MGTESLQHVFFAEVPHSHERVGAAFGLGVPCPRRNQAGLTLHHHSTVERYGAPMTCVPRSDPPHKRQAMSRPSGFSVSAAVNCCGTLSHLVPHAKAQVKRACASDAFSHLTGLPPHRRPYPEAPPGMQLSNKNSVNGMMPAASQDTASYPRSKQNPTRAPSQCRAGLSGSTANAL